MKRFPFLFFFITILSCNHSERNKRVIISEQMEKTKVSMHIDELNKAITKDPQNAKLYSNRGVYYIVQKKYDLAEKDLTQALKLNPKSAGAWDNLGTLKSRMNDYEGAFSAYSKAAELSPSDAQFLNNAGYSLLNLGLFERSIGYFDKAISADSLLNTAYANKGLALIGLNRQDDGCRLLKFSLGRGVKEAQTYIEQYCK